MKVYRIRNKKTGEFWETQLRKTFFKTIGGAKNSYTKAQRWPKAHTFNEQVEYEVAEYTLFETSECSTCGHNEYELRCGNCGM